MPGMQKIPEDAFLAAIEKIGPVQPIDMRKELKAGDSFLIGAMLSELVSKGKLLISKTRRGNAPFYYFPEKPETLEKIMQYLNEKDRRTCLLLKEQKVLREDAVEPLTRVGLQNIFDFSRRFTLLENGAEIVYWRYYLIPEVDARRIVADALTPVAVPVSVPDAIPVKAKIAIAKEVVVDTPQIISPVISEQNTLSSKSTTEQTGEVGVVLQKEKMNTKVIGSKQEAIIEQTLSQEIRMPSFTFLLKQIKMAMTINY